MSAKKVGIKIPTHRQEKEKKKKRKTYIILALNK
jgi:hypothetical protein